jgi:hypothetical protein
MGALRGTPPLRGVVEPLVGGTRGEASPLYEHILKKNRAKMIKGFDKFYSIIYNMVWTSGIVLSIMI